MGLLSVPKGSINSVNCDIRLRDTHRFCREWTGYAPRSFQHQRGNRPLSDARTVIDFPI
jgi:hypothetical protein